MNYKLVAYAADFTSFLLEQTKIADKTDQVILFGSTTREKNAEDIDIFIDAPENLENEIQNTYTEFSRSVKAKYWKLLGITKEIHITVGKPWPELQRSLISSGITLYGKYKGKTDLDPWFLFSIKQGRKRSRNVALWRRLYGYKQKNNKKIYETKGLVNEYGGRKIARGVFAIPAIHASKITNHLKQQKIPYQIHQFWQEK